MAYLLAVAAILLTAGNVAAQSTATVSYLAPGNESATYFASVVGVNPSESTFAIECGAETKPGIECGFTGPATLTVGPSSIFGILTDTYIFTVHCDFTGITGTTQAICTTTASGIGLTTTTTDVYSQVTYGTFLVTAGAEKLSSTADGKTPSGTITSGPAPSSASGRATTGTAISSVSKGAGTRSRPTKEGILAAILLWKLLG